MDTVLNQFSRLSSNLQNISFAKMLKMNDISASTQTHLKKTYMALCVGIIFSALGSYLHILFHLGGMATSIGCMLVYGLLASSRNESNWEFNTETFTKRVGLYLSFCALKGMSIGGLVEQALFLDPNIVLVAFIGTVLVFACFSGSALFAKRRSYLYLGGFLSSAMSVMFWMSIANMMFRSAAMYNVQIYGGLVLFSGYIICDTQMIIERAEMQGERDYLWSASQLFTDFVALFVRILIIVSRNARKGQSNNRRRENERRRRNGC